MLGRLDQILDDFSFLEDWEDRYRYVIEIGKNMPDLTETEKIEENRVHGCASQVWLIHETGEADDPIMTFRGGSDAFIVRGLVSIVLAVYSGRKASDIAKTDALETFRKIGLVDHLSVQRANGLNAMVTRIRELATRALSR